jgi:hypothetical protein
VCFQLCLGMSSSLSFSPYHALDLCEVLLSRSATATVVQSSSTDSLSRCRTGHVVVFCRIAIQIYVLFPVEARKAAMCNPFREVSLMTRSMICQCRYRGEKESNDVGVTVSESDDSFVHWARLWDLYHSKQLITTFKALMQRCGLKACSPCHLLLLLVALHPL